MASPLPILARREFLTYFRTPVAPVVGFFFLAAMGLTFWMRVAALSASASSQALGFAPVYWGQPAPLFWLAILLAAPFLTMHLFAEERRTGALDLLLSAPISEAHIVTAKYLASVAFYVLLLLPLFLFPLLLRAAAAPATLPPLHTPTFAFGLFLVGATFLAVGLLCSLLSPRPLPAATATLALLALLLAPGLLELPPAFDRILPWLPTISPAHHIRAFAAGIIDTRAIVFHLSTTLLLLLLSTRILELRRWR